MTRFEICPSQIERPQVNKLAQLAETVVSAVTNMGEREACQVSQIADRPGVCMYVCMYACVWHLKKLNDDWCVR